MNPGLTDVPETMLWTLHNRASEAARSDGVLRDPEALRIYQAIDYDYELRFGPADPSHAIRSAMFDHAIRGFLAEHPSAVVVNLGEGLETQRYRVTEPDTLWISVDLPEAIAARERFIPADDQHHHVGLSFLDRAWFDEVPRDRPTFLTAQGLFMYFDEADIRSLMVDMAARFPGGELMFDPLPRWLSRKTTSPKGWQKTPHYTTPPMPWGINRNEIEPTLRSWVPTLREVEVLSWWRFPRGFANRWVLPLMEKVPIINRHAPCVVRLSFS
ncbi:MAG: class I SAM-dependent methyltransferase [Acidobacteriota bacterium]